MDLSLNPRHTGLVPLDLAALFGNDNPVILEIGSGKGRFVVETATERPDRNLLAVEKSLHYHRVIVDRLTRRKLTNVRAINFDAFPVLEKMLPDGSISEIHVYFPDPWPRKKQQKRRIIRAEVLEQMKRVLTDEGWGIYVTDHREYFEAAAPVVESVFRSERRIPGPGDPPRTNYEAKYRAEGRDIFEIRFFKR